MNNTLNKNIRIHVNFDSLEESAKQQFDSCCAQDFVVEAALMPDAHSGYVAPIGSVIKTRGAIVPAWVGYDIGCGMIAVQISDDEFIKDLIKEKSKELFNEINCTIPMGAGRYNLECDKVYYLNDLIAVSEILRTKTKNNELFNTVNKLSPKNLGTLGSGNHFIEILEYEDETWLVIHSGSRGVGHYIGTYFMKAASGLDKGFEETYAIIDSFIPLKMEYIAYHDYCLEFSLLNRLSMAKKVEKAILKICNIQYDTEDALWCNKNHNHCIEIEPNVYLHRKGATSSDLDELGVIPANMRDGCFLVRGLGNTDFLNSSSHGAGRKLSRGEANRTITLKTFQQQMNGIVAPVNKGTLDESPGAYKDIFEVMELQKGSVEVIKHLRPIINWKG